LTAEDGAVANALAAGAHYITSAPSATQHGWKLKVPGIDGATTTLKTCQGAEAGVTTAAQRECLVTCGQTCSPLDIQDVQPKQGVTGPVAPTVNFVDRKTTFEMVLFATRCQTEAGDVVLGDAATTESKCVPPGSTNKWLAREAGMVADKFTEALTQQLVEGVLSAGVWDETVDGVTKPCSSALLLERFSISEVTEPSDATYRQAAAAGELTVVDVSLLPFVKTAANDFGCGSVKTIYDRVFVATTDVKRAGQYVGLFDPVSFCFSFSLQSDQRVPLLCSGLAKVPLLRVLCQAPDVRVQPAGTDLTRHLVWTVCNPTDPDLCQNDATILFSDVPTDGCAALPVAECGTALGTRCGAGGVSTCGQVASAACPQKCGTCGSQEYQSRTPTRSQDRICSSLTQCPVKDGYTLLAAHTETTDRSCGCSDGYFSTEFVAGRMKCEKWRECTAGTHYQSAAPTATTNRVCNEITACGANSEVEVVATLTADQICQCKDQFYNVNTACRSASISDTTTAKANCEAMGACEYTAPGAGAATCLPPAGKPQCLSYSPVCTADQYQSVQPDRTQDRQCKALTVCYEGCLKITNAAGAKPTYAVSAVADAHDGDGRKCGTYCESAATDVAAGHTQLEDCRVNYADLAATLNQATSHTKSSACVDACAEDATDGGALKCTTAGGKRGVCGCQARIMTWGAADQAACDAHGSKLTWKDSALDATKGATGFVYTRATIVGEVESKTFVHESGATMVTEKILVRDRSCGCTTRAEAPTTSGYTLYAPGAETFGTGTSQVKPSYCIVRGGATCVLRPADGDAPEYCERTAGAPAPTDGAPAARCDYVPASPASWTPCKPWTACRTATDEWIKQQPTAATDRQCADVKPCDVTTMRSIAPATATSNTVCECNAGTYLDETTFTCATLEDCTVQKAGVAQYISTLYTRTSNRACGVCTTCSAAGANLVPKDQCDVGIPNALSPTPGVAPLGGRKGGAGDCKCDAGYYDSAAGLAQTCTVHQSCQLPKVLTAVGSSTENAVCDCDYFDYYCTTGFSPDGSCAGACQPLTNCQLTLGINAVDYEDYEGYELTMKTKTSDRACACKTGFFKNSVTNRCQAWSTCVSGVTWERTAPTRDQDRVCQAVSPQCWDSGRWQEAGPTATQDRKCANRRDCANYQYQVQGAEFYTNTGANGYLYNPTTCASLKQCNGDPADVKTAPVTCSAMQPAVPLWSGQRGDTFCSDRVCHSDAPSGPAPCEVNWSDWSDCSVACGTGTQQRTYDRELSNPDNQVCPQSPQVQQCNKPACVDCVGSWGDFGTCIPADKERSGALCGEGTRTKTYVVSPKTYTGAQCPVADGATQAEVCDSGIICPAEDCVFTWEECAASQSQRDGIPCGDGTRAFSVTAVALHGGTPCPTAPESCNTGVTCTAENCIGEWGVYGTCTDSLQQNGAACASDAGGTMARQFAISSGARFGGTCEATQGQSQTQVCTAGPACFAEACTGAWGSWGACSKTCGTGSQGRSYAVTLAATNGGTCPAPQTQECNTQACVDCVGDWGAWGTCAASQTQQSGTPCGDGMKTRTYVVERPAETGGAACAVTNGATDSASCATGTICQPEACVGAFQTCSTALTCGTGTQVYLETSAARFGGAACAANNGASRSCKVTECTLSVTLSGSPPAAGAALEAYKAKVAAILAALMGVDVSRIVITGVTAGSVVVNFYVTEAPPNSPEAPTPEQAAANLLAVHENGSMADSFTSADMNYVGTSVAEPPEPTPEPTPDPAPEPKPVDVPRPTSGAPSVVASVFVCTLTALLAMLG
jgi:hypothetical protein